MTGIRIPGAVTPGGLIAPADAVADIAAAQDAAFADEGGAGAAFTPGADSDPWPSGKAAPVEGWPAAPYLYSVDLLAELGLMRVHSKNLLLRAVMPHREGSTLIVAHEHTRGAICFRIEAIAPDIEEAELYDPVRRPNGLKVGDEVLHLSASADPIDPRPHCRFFFVALVDIASSWDAALVRRILEEAGSMDLDALKDFARKRLAELTAQP